MNQKKKILIFSLTFLLISSITIFTLLPEFLANFQIKDFKPQAKDVSNLKVDNPEINAQDITHKLSLNSLNPFQVKTILAQTSPTGSSFIKRIWNIKSIEGDTYDEGFFIQQTSDGGYIITGDTNRVGAGKGDVFLIKLDSSGNLSWARAIGGEGCDFGRSIQQTSDGGYVITGYTLRFGAGDYDVFVIKLDSSGNLSWAKTIGGTNIDYGYSIQQTSDGGYIITGSTGFHGVYIITGSTGFPGTVFGAEFSDVFVIKLDSSGNIPGCSYIFSANPSVQSISPSHFFSVSPTLTSVTPSISSVSPSISNVSPVVNSICGPSISTPTLRPTPTPTPTLTLTPTPTPISTPLTPTSTPTSTPTPIPTPIGRTGYNVWGWIWSEREALIFILVVAILIIGGVFFVKIFKLKKIRK